MDQADVNIQDQYVAPPQPQEIAQEKMLPQSEINKIVGAQKQEAYERGKREALAAFQAEQQLHQKVQEASSLGGMPQMSDERIRDLIADEAQKRVHMDMAQRITGNFIDKMQGGINKYDDFEKTVKALNLQSLPHIVQLTANLENTPDVVYHLGKNPHKLATFAFLANSNPELAEQAMQNLSSSLKQNEEAAKVPSVNEPLSRLKPSLTGTDNGKTSISQKRMESWARM